MRSLHRRFQAAAIIVLLATPVCGQQTLSVFAGAKPPLTSGGAPAVQTPLGAVSAIAVGQSGTVYLADKTQALLMKVTPDGTLTVIGGNGSYSSPGAAQGDGGPATEASLAGGFPIALDSSENLFVVDYDKIRKITTDGILHTVLQGSQELPYGSGYDSQGPWSGFFPGLAVDSQGRVFFSEMPGARVWRFDPDATLTLIAGNGTYGSPAGDGGPAINAVLGEPQGIAVDSLGNVYITDGLGGLIREVSAANGTITTIAGGGSTDFRFGSPVAATSASLSLLESLAFDPQGDLCFFTYEPNLACISNGIISLVPLGQGGFSGDGGPASKAQFQPSGAYTSQFAIDGLGNVFIPDGGNGRVRKIDTSGTVTTIAGNGNYQFAGDGGPAANALINAPRYVSVDSVGNVYIADTGNYRVRRVTPDGIIQTVAGNGQTYVVGTAPPVGIPALDSALDSEVLATTGIPGGGFYFSETSFIREVDSSGTVTIAAGGLDPYLPLTNGSPATDLFFIESEGLAIGPDGCLYFTDDGAILKLNPNGTITTIAGKLDPFGQGGYSGIGGLAVDAVLGGPRGLAFSTLPSTELKLSSMKGADESKPARVGLLPVPVPKWPTAPIYFADVGNGRVLKIDSDGRIFLIAGNGQVGYSGDGGSALDAAFFYPQAVTVDRAGFIYVADWGNGCIRRISPAGMITTLVSGLSYPESVALDAKGTLYVADWGNNRILSMTNPEE